MEEADKRQGGEEEKETTEVEVGTEGINRLNGETDGESTQRRQKIGEILEGGANTCLPRSDCNKTTKSFLHSDLLSRLGLSKSFSNNSLK